jgi:cytochrome c-type biogenesis protein CcmH
MLSIVFWLRLLVLFSCGLSLAQTNSAELYRFDDELLEQRYLNLIQELRCLVCQNQSIADSNAELAQDMRRKTYELVRQGYTRQQVADFMATRYGNFVLYDPPFNLATALLWLAPLALLLLAIAGAFRYVRQQRSQ